MLNDLFLSFVVMQNEILDLRTFIGSRIIAVPSGTAMITTVNLRSL